MERSMLDRTKNIRQAARIIAENMISLRPRKEVIYVLRHKEKYIYDAPVLGLRKVDLNMLYPNAETGDSVYVSFYVESKEEFDAVLVTEGAYSIYIDGKKYENNEVKNIQYRQKRGRVLVELECYKKERFEVSFAVSVVYYPGMLAKDYLAHISMLCPMPEYDGEEGVGVSELCGNRRQWAYPKSGIDNKCVDFSDLYFDEDGIYAYALTYSKFEQKAKLNFFCPAKIIVNKDTVYNIDGGEISILLKKDDFLIIKCEKGSAWNFSWDGIFYLPFLNGGKAKSFAFVGTFGTEFDINKKYGPELYFDLKTPYKNYDADLCFFKTGKNEYITADMRTYFYSQWFYALMVGEYGLLDAFKLLGEEYYKEYFVDSITSIAQFYELEKWHKSVFGDSAFLQRGMDPDDLDSIGTIGVNLCELYGITKNSMAKKISDKLIDAINLVPRFDDGTFHRGLTMWADDTYMSCPFMIRYAQISGNNDWLFECVRQMLGFKKKLFMEEKGVFSHIYFVEEKKPNRVAWGRGNGWVFVTLSELLEKLPKNISGYDELRELYINFAEGIMRLQGDNGLWHQVLDIKESYEETSCTAMFIIGLARGIMLGLVGDEAEISIARAYLGLMKYKIDRHGNIYDVCRGSSCSMDAKYYMELGTVDNDDHGTGIVLSALYQMSRIKEDWIK